MRANTPSRRPRLEALEDRLAPAGFVPELVSTDVNTPTNGRTRATVGESATFHVTMDLDEGQSKPTTLDVVMPAGLLFTNTTQVISSPGVTLLGSPYAPTILPDGRTLRFDFGTVANADNDPATLEQIFLEFSAVVRNVATNRAGTRLGTTFTVNDGGAAAPRRAEDIVVVEPKLTVTQTVRVGNGGTAGPPGSPVRYTITLRNPAAGSTEAFEVNLTGTLPAAILSPRLVSASGRAAGNVAVAGKVLSATTPFVLRPGESAVIVVEGRLSAAAAPKGQVVNVVNLRWASLPGAFGGPFIPGVPGGTGVFFPQRRTATGGVNNYRGAAAVALRQLLFGSVSGHVYHDVNNNGVMNPGERGIAGATVTLVGTDNAGRAVRRTKVTDAKGFYLFADVPAGVYDLIETQPAGYLDGRDAAGSLGGFSGNDFTSRVAIRAGSAGVRYDFGERLPVSKFLFLASSMR